MDRVTDVFFQHLLLRKLLQIALMAVYLVSVRISRRLWSRFKTSHSYSKYRDSLDACRPWKLLNWFQALDVCFLFSLSGFNTKRIRAFKTASYSQKMLLVDALSGDFRTIKLRGRKIDCAVCGDSPSITQLIDYVQFCGSSANDKVCVAVLVEGQKY